jgi:hypothetical protein
MKTSDIKNLGNAYRSIYEAKTKEEVSDNKDFKPHMMYDPETGKGYKAEKPEDHERMSKMGYTHEEPDMVKEKKLPRQMLDPKKDVMVVKNNKVLVVDKSKEKEYLKKGWGLAEQIEEEKDKKNEGKKRFKRHDGIGKAKYTISYHDGKKKHKDGSDFFDIKIFKNEKDLSDFVGTLAKQGYKLTRESVIEEAKVLDNMSQLPYPDIERPLKSMQQVKKDADLGRMEITHIVKNKQGNKVVAAVVSNGKKNFVYVNNKGVAPLKEETLDEAKGKYASDAQMDDFLKGIENHPDVKKMSKHYNRPVEDIVKELRRMVMVNRLKGGNVYRLDFTDKDSKLKVKTKKQYAPTNEAVSPEQQAAIAINKKEKEEMKNEGSVKDLAMKIDRVVAKMNKDSKLKPFAKKFASMAMDTMDIEKSLEKVLPSSVSGAKMISMLEKKLDPVDDAENDKKFKDRKDKDIDNDGDVDDSDEYLHNRRAKVDDAIDGGKKPAKKEEDDKKKVVAKSPKTAEISKIGEDFVAMLEASLLEKAEPEAMDDKESPKGKEFIGKHKKSEKDLEDKQKEAEEETPKAGKVTKEKSGKRTSDSTVGDKEVVKSTEAPIKEMTLVDMARAHLAGKKVDFSTGKVVKEKNPYDGRMKLAKEFMQRMDKRKGVKND